MHVQLPARIPGSEGKACFSPALTVTYLACQKIIVRFISLSFGGKKEEEKNSRISSAWMKFQLIEFVGCFFSSQVFKMCCCFSSRGMLM